MRIQPIESVRIGDELLVVLWTVGDVVALTGPVLPPVRGSEEATLPVGSLDDAYWRARESALLGSLKR